MPYTDITLRQINLETLLNIWHGRKKKRSICKARNFTCARTLCCKLCLLQFSVCYTPCFSCCLFCVKQLQPRYEVHRSFEFPKHCCEVEKCTKFYKNDTHFMSSTHVVVNLLLYQRTFYISSKRVGEVGQ